MAVEKRGTRTAKRNSIRRRAAPPDRPPPRWRIWLKRLFIWGGALAALLLLALGTSVYFAARSMPGYATLMSRQVGQTIVVRARDGSEIVALGPSYGEWLHSDEIPQVMKDAMVSVEDRRFYSHFGVDVPGLARALYVALRHDEPVRATSTITQQLARNVFLNSNRTLDRKLREGVLAMALEWKFSKEQILELYLNKVYFGGGAYGIDSASRKFFSHSARDLSTAEAAIIAGMVKAPSRYSPTCCRTTASSRSRCGPRSISGCRRRPPSRCGATRRAGRRARSSASTATGRSSRSSVARTTSSRATTAPRRRCASRARRGSCSFTWPRSRPATRPTTAWSTSR